MRRSRKRMALFAMVLAFGSQAAAAPCVTDGASDAKELTFDTKDEKIQHGLEHAFLVGLTPATLSEASLRALKISCTRGAISVGDETLQISGENADSPPRWTQSEVPDSPVIFVVKAPRPEAALKKAESGPLIGTNLLRLFEERDLMYIVVVTHGAGDRFVTHFFDKLPNDQKLKSVFTDIVSNKVSIKAGFHVGDMQEFKPQNPAPKN